MFEFDHWGQQTCMAAEGIDIGFFLTRDQSTLINVENDRGQTYQRRFKILF